MKPSLLVPTAAIVLAVAFGSVPSAAQAPIDSKRIGHVRVERTILFQEKWESSCESDGCGIAILFQLPVDTPKSTRLVDVTMTVAFDYKTGPEPGDHADVYASYSRRRNRPPVIPLRPKWRLAAAPQWDTTSLIWQKHDVRAGGRRYFFEMSVPSREGGVDDNENFVRGKHLTVIVEMWPAGN